MFEAQLSQALILKKLIDSLKDLVSEVNLEVSSEGISLQAMDASHVALVMLLLRREHFLSFSLDRNQSIGISMSNLSKIIKCAENEDSVILRVDNTQLTLIFEGKTDDKISEFNLNLLTLDSEHLAISEENYASIVTLSTSEFANTCKSLSQMSDTLNMDINGHRIVLSVNGDIGKGAISLRHGEKGLTSINTNESVNVSFAIRYLNLFNKAGSLGNSTALYVSEDKPLIMKIDFNIGEIKYYLAPKVNDN